MSKPKPQKQVRVEDSHRAQTLFDDFEVSLARAILDANGKDIPALQVLGQALTRSGRHQEALEADLRLAGLRPRDPVAYYNLACSYSNIENLDGAFDALRRAFELGYNDYRHLLKDPDLRNLRKDRRFKAFLDKKWGKRSPG